MKRLQGVSSSLTKWLQESEFYGDAMRVDGYHCLLGGILTSRSETVHPQSTVIAMCPARIPPRSPHQPAHSFDFDSLALCLDSGRRHAHVHPLALIRVAGRQEHRNFKDNPGIVSLLTGGGGRDVATVSETFLSSTRCSA